MLPIDRPHTIFYQSSIATVSLSCTVSEILSFISQNLQRSRDHEHIPLGVNLCMHDALVLLCVNQHTTSEMPSFTYSKDMIEAKIKKKDHATLITPIRR